MTANATPTTPAANGSDELEESFNALKNGFIIQYIAQREQAAYNQALADAEAVLPPQQEYETYDEFRTVKAAFNDCIRQATAAIRSLKKGEAYD